MKVRVNIWCLSFILTLLTACTVSNEELDNVANTSNDKVMVTLGLDVPNLQVSRSLTLEQESSIGDYALFAYEGETFEISGEIEFGTPSGGVINQFFIQECVSYSAPLGYNVIVDYESETGLAGRKESFSGEWVVSPEQVGMHSNFEFFLTWQSDNGNEADEICNLILKNFQIKRK